MWSLTEDYDLYYKDVSFEVMDEHYRSYYTKNNDDKWVNLDINEQRQQYIQFLEWSINKHRCSWEYLLENATLEAKDANLEQRLKVKQDYNDELEGCWTEINNKNKAIKKKYEDILRTIDCRTLSEGEYMDYAVMMKDDYKDLKGKLHKAKKALGEELVDNAFNKEVFKAKWNNAVDRIKELEAENKQLKGL